jgi:hypothetical protein
MIGSVPLMNMDEAQAQLAPVADALLVTPRRSGVSTWNAFEADAPGIASAISTTTRAGMIHDFTVLEVRRALQREDVKSVAREIDSPLEFFTVAVGSGLLVRYKLVAARMPRNVATDVQRRLAAQQYDEETMNALALDGMPTPPTLVTCGYTLDVDGRLGTVSVQCDFKNATMWRYVAWGDSGEGFGTFETLPIDPNLSPEATIVRSAKEGKQRPDAISEG